MRTLYSGDSASERIIWIQALAFLSERISITGKLEISKSARNWLQKRSKIKPLIGHLKVDHRMGRNFLLGTLRDKNDNPNKVLFFRNITLRIFRAPSSKESLEPDISWT